MHNIGASKFLKRLDFELSKINLPDYQILNPTLQSIGDLKRSGVKIARLDGVIFTKFTTRNFLNFLELWKGVRIPYEKKIPYYESHKITLLLNRYLNRVNVELMTKSDAIVFQSHLSKKMHDFFLGFNDDNYSIVHNGAKKNFSSNNSFLFCKSNRRLSLVIAANFRPHKRLIEAIKLTNNLRLKFPNIILNIAGNIDCITKDSMKGLDCSCVKFHGNLTQEQLNSLFKKSDIGLSLSIFDPCPNSVVEMMSCGLPVISNERSGAIELLNYDDRFYVNETIPLNFMEFQTISELPKIDIDKWSEKVEEVVSNYGECKERIMQIFEENLDIKIVARKYANIICNADRK